MKWKHTKNNDIPEPYTMCLCDMQDHYEVLCWEQNKTYSRWCLDTPDNEFYYKLTDVVRWVYIDELEKTIAD